eukprot:scaffold426_cov219-Amphora_coffeaeformis.AAC.41
METVFCSFLSYQWISSRKGCKRLAVLEFGCPHFGGHKRSRGILGYLRLDSSFFSARFISRKNSALEIEELHFGGCF